LTSARETFSADEQKYNQSGQSISASDASLNSAWLSYEATQDSVVIAPIGGTVANISVKPGDQVTASGGSLSSNNNSSNSSSSSSSNAILYIGDYSKPYVKVQANEVDITSIHAGQKATMTLSAFPDKTFVGSVDQVDTAGTISSGVVTYNVYVTFVAPPSDIKPGMSASVTIQTARKDNVLMVPTGAVQTTNGQATVRVLTNGKISSVPVETGLSSDTDIEITSGLSEGETVVTNIITSTTQSTGQTTSPFSGLGGGGRGFGGGGAVFRSGGR
jgi:multidrug efflux pump subunit AcrA (membrane-fusion protein)